jgi:hypothetical protein
MMLMPATCKYVHPYTVTIVTIVDILDGDDNVGVSLTGANNIQKHVPQELLVGMTSNAEPVPVPLPFMAKPKQHPTHAAASKSTTSTHHTNANAKATLSLSSSFVKSKSKIMCKFANN